MAQALLAEQWQDVERRVASAARRSGRAPADIKVVAVTKTVPPEVVREALGLGLLDLGENRVQEALAKQSAVGRHAATWHLIGSLQTNKARRAVESFDLIHSLDRLELAEALDRAGESTGARADVLIQVNVAGEAAKHGLPPAELPDFVRRVLSYGHLRLRGLMTIAPLAADPEEARPVFGRLRQLFLQVAEESAVGSPWQWLSMGMSQDFEVAIEEGANLVRIGTALFGRRQPAGR